MKKQISTIFVLLISAFTILDAQTAPVFQILKTFHIASSGGWDYLAVGPSNDWLYVSHGTQVNILNKNTGDSAGVIPNTVGVHGIAFDISNNKGFTSNGRTNSVTVFAINNNNVLTEIPVGRNPDAILYEPFSKTIITCNGGSSNLSIIDPRLNKVIDSVYVGGKPETAVSDGQGKLYVNIEDKNEIVVIDTRQFKIAAHWSISPGQSPTGLAIDRNLNRLFTGCDGKLIVVDAANGIIVDKISIGNGCDGVAFDPLLNNIYTSNGSDGTLTVIHEETASAYLVKQNLITKKGARTIALDTKTHLIYTPTAEFEKPDASLKGRPVMRSGTFQVIVIGQ